jgi:hypothetical protein
MANYVPNNFYSFLISDFQPFMLYQLIFSSKQSVVFLNTNFIKMTLFSDFQFI